MNRELRRTDRKLTEEEAAEILKTATYGILSTVGEDNIPYGVPLSYCYQDNKIYFHSAMVGHKLDNIAFNNQVSFCVVTDVETLPAQFGTKYRSVILFGTIQELEVAEKKEAYKLFINKYANDFQKSGMEYIQQAGNNARVFEISIERMIGKGRK
jgi:nitroimidazol reductase NimA-like FMN-containing flavoprotein (pyridoxamine 5'-phosphate oxidase superfamily)